MYIDSDGRLGKNIWSGISLSAGTVWDVAMSPLTQVYEGIRFALYDPNFQAYNVWLNPDTGKIEVIGKTDAITNKKAYSNGMNNDLETAMEYAIWKSGAAPGEVVTLLYNPSHGFLADLVESGYSRLGMMTGLWGPTSVARQQAALFANIPEGQPTQWFNHSQAGLTADETTRIMRDAGNIGMNNIRMVFQGSAINRREAMTAANRIGAQFNPETDFRVNYFDTVPQLIAMDGNPVEIALATVAFPSLILGPMAPSVPYLNLPNFSPHSHYDPPNWALPSAP